MARDPVCGMEVDEKRAVAKSEYKGRTYYFCAPGCKKAFDENPQKYLKEEPSMPGMKHGCCYKARTGMPRVPYPDFWVRSLGNHKVEDYDKGSGGGNTLLTYLVSNSVKL